MAPAAARYFLSKNNFISNETPHQARHCIREKGKRPNHQTASPGSPFLCKVASEGTDTESKRSRQSKKCTPTRQLLAELPSFSLHPARHDSTWAMSFGQDGTNWPGHVPAAPARADGRKAWRAEVPAGEDEIMRKRKAGKRWRRSGISSACRVTLLFGALHGSCGAHRQARGAVAGGFGQRNCHEHRAGHDPAHSARHGERYVAM